MTHRTQSSHWAFRIMSLIHDNPIRRKLSNPNQTLETAGIKVGQKVLEIGCGPGFFTIPAARIVGETGIVYALDIHPLAIESVKKKINDEIIDNVTLLNADATNTGLPDQSIDLAFLFGVPRLLRNELVFKDVLKELYRILRFNGVVSIKSSKKKLIKIVETNSMSFLGQENGILKFKRK